MQNGTDYTSTTNVFDHWSLMDEMGWELVEDGSFLTFSIRRLLSSFVNLVLNTDHCKEYIFKLKS